MRGQRGRLEDNPDGEIDEKFWAQAAADQAAGHVGDDDNGTLVCRTHLTKSESNPTGADGEAIPFSTQFFHDDDDDDGLDPGFDDAFGGEPGESDAPAIDPGEQDLLAATAGQTRRVRPEFVNYAKRAKRVDVRKLKENIWKGLDIVVPEPDPERMVCLKLPFN
jgi:condensin complex subunit 2